MKHKHTSGTFGQQKVEVSSFLPMPEGYEKLFIALYFIVIPYMTGLIFIFLFVAKAQVDNFLSLDLAMFVAVWAIGYEVVASFALAFIFYKMFRFNREARSETRTVIRDVPEKKLYTVHKLS